jgi:hypothetical protein
VPSENSTASSLVLSYLGLRKAVGIIGTSLPFVLVFGKLLLDGPGIQASISDYYYTSMRNVFVGSLCAIGVFLMSYRGYSREDDITGDLACVFAVGVALFPTVPATISSGWDVIIGRVHLGFASAFFLTLAYFCLVLFRRTNPNKSMTGRKRQRNVVYTICGYAILVCIGLIVLVMLLSNSGIQKLDPVFWLESAAVLSFGISWLTKGEAILGDLKS